MVRTQRCLAQAAMNPCSLHPLQVTVHVRGIHLRNALADALGLPALRLRRVLTVPQDFVCGAGMLEAIDVPARVGAADAFPLCFIPIKHRVLRRLAIVTRAEVMQDVPRVVEGLLVTSAIKRPVRVVGEHEVRVRPGRAIVGRAEVLPARVGTASTLLLVQHVVQDGEAWVRARVAAAQLRHI